MAPVLIPIVGGGGLGGPALSMAAKHLERQCSIFGGLIPFLSNERIPAPGKNAFFFCILARYSHLFQDVHVSRRQMLQDVKIPGSICRGLYVVRSSVYKKVYFKGLANAQLMSPIKSHWKKDLGSIVTIWPIQFRKGSPASPCKGYLQNCPLTISFVSKTMYPSLL